jgi:hypothetical protein
VNQNPGEAKFLCRRKIQIANMKPTKILQLSLVLALIILATFFLINRYDEQIVNIYYKLFPGQRYKPFAYWADLTNLLFTEFVMLALFTIATIYFTHQRDVIAIMSKTESALLKNSRFVLIIITLIFFALAWYTASYTLDKFPNSSDEYAYLFEAEGLSKGKLWNEAHPLADFFEFNHIAQIDNKWISRFPPGWPLVLASAYVLHIPTYMINPILGALTLVILYIFCARFYDERVAFWSTIITAFSACVIFNSASFFSHTASLLELLLFIYFAYRYFDEKKIYQALLAGFFFGMLFITRYLTAVLVFIPFLVYAFHRYKLKSIAQLLWIGVGTLPPMLFFFWYNYSITGNPLMPVTMWAYNDEAMGFVNGHTPAKGFQFIMRRVMMTIAWISPAGLILYPIFLWQKVRNKTERFIHPEDYWLPFLIVGYFFYYHHGGNQYGPRFYFEAIPFVIIFIVNKAFQQKLRWAYAMLFTGILYAVVKFPIISRHEYLVIKEREDIYRLAQQKGLNNAVVIISSWTGILRPMPQRDLPRNDKKYSNSVIYALDLKDRNPALMKYYDDKAFYVYKRPKNSPTGELIKLREPGSNSIPKYVSKTNDHSETIADE